MTLTHDVWEDSRPRIEVIDVLTFEPDRFKLEYYHSFQPRQPSVEIPIAIENALKHALGLPSATSQYALVKLMRILKKAITRGKTSIRLYLIKRIDNHIRDEEVVYTNLQKLKPLFDVYYGYLAVRKQMRKVEKHIVKVAKEYVKLSEKFQAFQHQMQKVTKKVETMPAYRLVKEQEQVRMKARKLLREVTKERERIEKAVETAKQKKGMIERAKEFVKSAVSKLVNVITSPFSRVFGKKDGPRPGERKP